MSANVIDFDVDDLTRCILVLGLRSVPTTTATTTTTSTATSKQQQEPDRRRRRPRRHRAHRHDHDEQQSVIDNDPAIELIRSLSVDDVERAYRRAARKTRHDKMMNGSRNGNGSGQIAADDATVRFQQLESAKQKIIQAIKQRIWNTHRAAQSQQQQSQHSAGDGDEWDLNSPHARALLIQLRIDTSAGVDDNCAKDE